MLLTEGMFEGENLLVETMNVPTQMRFGTDEEVRKPQGALRLFQRGISVGPTKDGTAVELMLPGGSTIVLHPEIAAAIGAVASEINRPHDTDAVL